MKRLIYTAIYGGYDTLRQPCEKLAGWDYVCVSDHMFDGGIWDVTKFPASYGSVKTSKFVKILLNPQALGYDIGIWIDGSMEVIGNLNAFINEINEINTVGLYLPRHPHHKTLRRELEACIALKKDDPHIMTMQVDGYGEIEPYEFTQNNVIIKASDVSEAMDVWWKEVKHKSCRDQLSFGWAMQQTGQRYGVIEQDVINRYFKWHKYHT